LIWSTARLLVTMVTQIPWRHLQTIITIPSSVSTRDSCTARLPNQPAPELSTSPNLEPPNVVGSPHPTPLRGTLERPNQITQNCFISKASQASDTHGKPVDMFKYNHYNTLDFKKKEVPKSTVKITLPSLEMWTKKK